MNDNNNDKPFACNIKGCEMKFSNVDHLSVHQKKHKFSLNLPQTSVQIADQTPTPSRFLGRFLENWGDIQEITDLTPILNDQNNVSNNNNNNGIHNNNSSNNTNTKSSSMADNPFADAFQNALKNTNNNNLLKTPELLSRGITDSPLNTPSIFLSSSNEGLMAIVNAALNTPDHEFAFNQSPEVHNNQKTINHNDINTINTNPVSIDNSLSSQSSNSSYIDANTASAEESSDTSCGKSVSQQLQTIPINVVKPQKFQAVSVICSANTNFINPTVSQTIPNIVISQPNNNQIKSNVKLKAVPIAQTSKNAAIIAPKTKESSITIGNANSLYKVILKFPDGKTVQLPLLQQPITNTIVSSAAQTITAITNSSKINNFNNISNDETIHLANKSSSSQAIQISGTSFSSLQSKVDATLASLPPKAKPGRKSKFAPEEDPKEKKARSLERNRAAAMRCRLKRKHWIDSLEEKADEYEKINEKLQSEVVVLRKEVTLLKTALLAHKDCPVTLQQQKANNASTECITIYTTNGNSINNGYNHNYETNGKT